jgi:hypothetical protein
MIALKNLFKKQTPPDSARTLGRNDPCWCGSGQKYKKCHSERDRLYFAQQRAQTCRGGS